MAETSDLDGPLDEGAQRVGFGHLALQLGQGAGEVSEASRRPSIGRGRSRGREGGLGAVRRRRR